VTLAQASSSDASVREQVAPRPRQAAAKLVGELMRARASERGSRVVFDRRLRLHGRVQALAEGAREKGLQF